MIAGNRAQCVVTGLRMCWEVLLWRRGRIVEACTVYRVYSGVATDQSIKPLSAHDRKPPKSLHCTVSRRRGGCCAGETQLAWRRCSHERLASGSKSGPGGGLDFGGEPPLLQTYFQQEGHRRTKPLENSTPKTFSLTFFVFRLLVAIVHLADVTQGSQYNAVFFTQSHLPPKHIATATTRS